jgi:hypothetical protein
VALTAAVIAGAAIPAAAQKIQVKSANPSAATQGTTNLEVTIGGSGFSPGARAEFHKSGTTDPGGIRVNSTTFVSATQLKANLDVAGDAAISLFDIKVSASGRSGKGTDLFRVDPKQEVCILPESDPGHFQLLSKLNYSSGSGPRYSRELGLSIGVGQAVVPLPDGSAAETLVVFAGTYGNGTVEVFFVDPITGAVRDGTPLGAAGSAQPHLTVPLPYAATTFAPYVPDIAVADLNGDRIPDAVAADADNVVVAGLLSEVTSNGTVSYRVAGFPLPPTAAMTFGKALAIGDVDGLPGAEIVLTQKDGSSKSTTVPARLYGYRLAGGGSSFELVFALSPSLQAGDNFGNWIAIGDVTGDGRPDVVGGAPGRDVGRATDAGAVLVFQGVGNSPPYQPSGTPIALTVATPQKNDALGQRGTVGNADTDASGQADVIALAGYMYLSGTGPQVRGVVFGGPLMSTSKETPAATFVAPSPELANGWGLWTIPEDVDGSGLNDIVVSAGGAHLSPACQFAGTVYVYAAQADSQGRFSSWARRQLYAPEGDSAHYFGSATYTVPSRGLLFVGHTGSEVGGVAGAGQIYVYRVY